MSNFTLIDPNLTQLNEPTIDIKKEEAIALLKQLIEPILHNNIVDLGMVRNLRIVDDYVYLRLYLGQHQL
jgi:ATP-binding protein involved in chromosome partitioning